MTIAQRLNKTNISRFCKWSKSRYNAMPKKDFVEFAFNSLLLGGIKTVQPIGYEAGDVTPSGHKVARIEHRDNLTDFVYVKKTSVIETGGYTPSSHMTGIAYLINPMQSYIASGQLDEDGNFIEKERQVFYFV